MSSPTKNPAHRRVEIIIVLLVIAGLAAYSIPRFFKAHNKNKDESCQLNITEIVKAMEEYELAYDEAPTVLDALYGAGKVRESAMPVCPFNGRYSLRNGQVLCDHEAR